MKNNPSKSPKLSSLSLAAIAAAICFSINILSSNIHAQEEIILPKGAAGAKIEQRSLGAGAETPHSTGNIRQVGISQTGDFSVDGVGKTITSGRGLQSIGGEGPAPVFKSGIDESSESPWSEWNEPATLRSFDPLGGFKQIAHEPSFAPGSLTDFAPQEFDDQVLLFDKMNGLAGTIIEDVERAEALSNVVPADSVNAMLDAADGVYAPVDQAYADIDAMYDEIDKLYKTLDENYAGLEQYESITPEVAASFNSASDAMADRVAGMGNAVDGMINKVTSQIEDINSLLTAADHMDKDGNAAMKFCDDLFVQIDAATKQHELLAQTLEKNNPYDFFPGELSKAPDVFKDQKDYLKSLKDYIQKSELKQIDDVRKYINEAKAYLEKVLKDLENTRANLKDTEDYFRKSKVGDDFGRDGIQTALEGGESNACTQDEEVQGLDTLQNCAKSCRTVCRWKKKGSDGSDCYECPSGSPDTCYDLTPPAWPSDHPWCQPGGICHSDPMLYCSPFGATGPNLEALSCTNCKQRPDLCWQKAGGGMTFTNCKLGCWNGTCVFKGKYQEFEWDGTLEWVHCYECKTPPPPPTCEELGWGYDWEGDCKRNCPDPGKCVEETKKMGGKPPAPPAPPDKPGEQPGGGQPGGQQAGGDEEGGDTKGRDQGDGGDTGGQKPNPPTGTPEQPGGGGGQIAGGDKKPEGQPEQPEKKDGTREREQPPKTDPPEPPKKPEVKKPDVTDEKPPAPPDNAEIQSLKTRIRQVIKILEDRDEIIADPREGDRTKAEAARQIEAYEKELADLEERLRQEELKELERQRKAIEEEQRRAEAERQRDATRTRWPDPVEEMRKIRLKELKDAIDQLNQRAREIKDVLTGRKEHIDRLNREINFVEREIEHRKEIAKEDSTQERTIKNLEKDLAHKKWLRDQLTKQLNEAQKQANAELEKLRKTYLKKLYAVDERARRQEEAKRIDEFYSLWEEREQIKASRDARNKAFEEKFKQMEDEIAAAKARGDNDTAERLQTELDNMKRGKEDWDKNYESRLKNVEERMYQTGYHDNFDDGVGPNNEKELAAKLDEYGKIIDNEIEVTEKRIAELEKLWKEGKIGTSVRADGSEHVDELDKLRDKLEQLKGNREGIAEKLNTMKNGFKLPDDIAANIQDSTDKYAEGSKNRGEDKSFTRLFAESLAEEAVHNLRPDVALKKSVAFGVGMVEGVGSVVKDLAMLGVGIVDLSIEMHLTNLGFDIETDSFDALNSMLTTIGDNANFDGVIKATVALGGAIDQQIKALERSGDIDTATARLGGKGAGMVIGEVLTDKGLGALGTAVGLGDDAVDAGRAVGKVDDAMDAGRAGTRARSSSSGMPDTTPVDTPDVLKPPKTPDTPPSTAGAGSRPRGTPDAPDGPTVRTPDDGPGAPGGRPRGDRPDAPDRPDSTRPKTDTDKPPDTPDAPPPPKIPDPDAPKPKPADDIADGAADAGKVDDAAPPRDTPADAPPKQTPDPEPPAAQPAPAAKADDVPVAKVEPPPARAPPPPPKAYDNARPLPDAPQTGKKPTQLTDDALQKIENQQGFRKDHAQRMHEFAQEKDAFLLVRDGNPDSVKYFGDADKVPKPMSSKAKTAKVGPDQGLVVDPTHAKQAAEWDLAIKKAAAKAVKTGDFAELDKLKAAHQKALKSWADYGEEMLAGGYKVDPDTGRVLMKTTDANGNEAFKAVHGDYDLHGVYRKGPDGSMEQVSFGEGNKFDANGVDTSGGTLRNQLNDKISGGDKDFIQHGGQDDWIPDPDHVPVKPPDPPVTVFFPDGRPPVRLTTKAEMQDFYENVMGVQWPYKSVDNATGAASAAMKASDDALKAGNTVTDAVPSTPSAPKSGLTSGTGSAQSPPKAGSLLDDNIKTAIDAPGSSPATGSATQKFDDVIPAPGSGTQKFDDVLQPPGSGTQKFDDVLQPPGSATQKFDDVLKAPEATNPPRAGIPPNSTTTIKGPDGKPMTLNVGDELGHGSTSTVFADATDPKKAIRITEPGKGGITEAVKLDDAGRKAVQDIQKPGGPIRIVEEGKPVTVKDPNSPLNGKVVEVVERLPSGSADKMLPSQGGKLSDGQAKAFIDATEELNKNGYAWMDNHSGNYGFEKVDGTTDEWRVVVLDPGGIVPMKGRTLAEKADNARALQARINIPEEGTTEFIKGASDGMKQNFAKAERGEIIKEFGGEIDIKAMGIKNPNDIAFYPLGTAELPEIQKLSPR